MPVLLSYGYYYHYRTLLRSDQSRDEIVEYRQ